MTRELFTVASVNATSTTTILTTVNHDKLREEQTAEYCPYTDYFLKQEAPLPDNETPTTISYHSVQDGLLLK